MELINLEFLVVLLIVSKSVDWILQTRWQVENKSINTDALFIHSLIYAVVSLFITMYIVYDDKMFYWWMYTILLMWILTVTHILIDNRSIVIKIMKFKGITQSEIDSGQYNWLQIQIDQRLHELVILVIALII